MWDGVLVDDNFSAKYTKPNLLVPFSFLDSLLRKGRFKKRKVPQEPLTPSPSI